MSAHDEARLDRTDCAITVLRKTAERAWDLSIYARGTAQGEQQRQISAACDQRADALERRYGL